MRRIFALLAVLVLVLSACAPDKFRATDITGADFARTLQLTGHDGKPRSLADFVGKVVVVIFRYPQCPDVCPTTLSHFASVVKELGPDADRLQVLFVIVDPERDTQQVLRFHAGPSHLTTVEIPGSIRPRSSKWPGHKRSRIQSAWAAFNAMMTGIV